MIAVNVAQLLRAQVGTFRSYEFSEQEPDLTAELNLRSPIEGRVKLTRTPRGILAEVAYHVALEQECGRCLEPVRTELDSQFSEEYIATTNVLTGQPSAVTAEAEEQTISPNHELDLTDAIRQDIVVQQPLQPLCGAECAGLCLTCGADLNRVACNHEAAAHADEQPLGRLGELLKQQLPPEAQARN
ncbi:MAG: DUF177 domain-containing protein [Chloroflexota bacterium]|nr:DUF177 domain-containing protein [Chloroflexota bacterium]